MKIVTTAEMRGIEDEAGRIGLPGSILMAHAGAEFVERLAVWVREYQQRDCRGLRVVVLVGPGNNGGDGLVAAAHLHDRGAAVAICTYARRKDSADENIAAVQQRSIPIYALSDDPEGRRLNAVINAADILIDAVFGTGLSRDLAEDLQQIFTRIGGLRAERGGRPLVVALDCPSGINTDTGAMLGGVLPADLTITLAFPKTGLFRFPAVTYKGQLLVGGIGLPSEFYTRSDLTMISIDEVRKLLPSRSPEANKGDFGRALVVAGSLDYVGAGYLSSMGALRSGVGLVTLSTGRSTFILQAARLVEATFLPLPESGPGIIDTRAVTTIDEKIERYTALLVGPGLGEEESTWNFIRLLLGVEQSSNIKAPMGFARLHKDDEKHHNKDQGRHPLPPLILDADALNCLAKSEKWWKILPANSILTPHPGEMARLTTLTAEEVNADREGIAKKYAKEWQQIVVLKGAHTVIASPEGRVAISPFANPGLASGGTGDVLAGLITGLRAQGLAPFDAAVVGVYVHGAAGEKVRANLGDQGMIATDLLPELPRVFHDLHAL